MSYSINTNILLYASDSSSAKHLPAADFIRSRSDDTDLMCLTWPVLLGYLRIATHPAIFQQPLQPVEAWQNINMLLALPRCRLITEEGNFADTYQPVTEHHTARGNLVPDAHIATLLQQHGVDRIYSSDQDFRKFDFLKVIDPT